MRRGEVVGLQWEDVDLERVRLSVRPQIVDVASELIIEDLKTTTGRRTVYLDPRTVAVLRSWRKSQLEERMELGLRPTHNELVFAKPDGTPTHPDTSVRCSTDTSRSHHCLASGCTTSDTRTRRILLKAGLPVKVVSERLGHASPAFTMTLYQHLLPGMQADAAATFGDIVFGE